MMDSPIIDLVILLTFTYFTSSLILSSINEGISQGIFHLREKNLKKAIEVLFISAEWKKYVKSDFVKSPHIQSLMRDQGKYPTYIPANNFMLFVIEKIGSEHYLENKLQESIKSANIPLEFKKVLLDLAAKGDNKLDAFERNLTQFYDDALENSTVWYRKKVRRILLALGFVLSVALNIDTIMIANDALSNTKELSRTVNNIIAQLPDIQVQGDSTTQVVIRNDKGKVIVSQQVSLSEPITQKTDGTVSSSISNIEKVRVMYETSSGLYLGYQKGEFMDQWFGHGILGFLLKLIGMVITAFAVQLGSNYWFDIMKKALSMKNPARKAGIAQTAISK